MTVIVTCSIFNKKGTDNTIHKKHVCVIECNKYNHLHTTAYVLFIGQTQTGVVYIHLLSTENLFTSVDVSNLI